MRLDQHQSFLQLKGVEIVPGNREFKATLENLQFVKLYQNAEEVIEKLKDNSKHLNRIAVVGGGYIGVELAEAFERLGKRCCLGGYRGHCLEWLL